VTLASAFPIAALRGVVPSELSTGLFKGIFIAMERVGL
jgi:hypothetical protein